MLDLTNNFINKLKDNQKIVEIHGREYIEEIDSDEYKFLFTLDLENETYWHKSYKPVEIEGNEYIEIIHSDGDKRLYTLDLKNGTSFYKSYKLVEIDCGKYIEITRPDESKKYYDKNLEKVTLTNKAMKYPRFGVGDVVWFIKNENIYCAEITAILPDPYGNELMYRALNFDLREDNDPIFITWNEAMEELSREKKLKQS